MPTNFEKMIEKERKTIENIVKLLQYNPNLILYGPPGTGKTYTAKAVALYLLGGEEAFDNDSDDWANELDKYKELGRWKIVQFHPSYNYDDFVVGIEAKTEDKQVVFEKVWRALGEMSRRALVSLVLGKEKLKEFVKEDKKEIYEQAKREWKEGKRRGRDTSPLVLIIDEINRANLPAVLGELIYALEYRGEEIDIMYGEKLMIPPNLYIIGTMNTADRSAGRIDYAIRRRFTFYPMHAEINRADDYGQPLMEAVNKFIEMNISPEYDPEDIKIGHTYFMGESADEIAYKFLYQVVPLLYEYIQDGLIRAERERGERYKVKLKFPLNNGNTREEIYYIRGGRLYENEEPMTLNEMKEFLKKLKDSNNGEENADSKQEKPEESQQPEK